MANFLDEYAGSPEQVARDEPTEGNMVRWQEMGKGWDDLIFATYRAARKGVALERISIRVGWRTNDDSLVTLVAVGEQGSVVAFHGAENPATMWQRLASRWLRDRLEWRPDEYG